jgi:ERCC4-type nuclease
MTLLVDDRAGSRELVRYEPVKSLGELTRLDSADVALAGNGPDGAVLIGVEVKSVWDLVSSANTGRLQATQVPAMLEEYDVSWLLTHGGYRAANDGRLMIYSGNRWRGFKLGKRPVPYGYVEALLLDLAAMSIHIKHAGSVNEAAQWLGVLHRWWNKPWDKHRGMRTLDKSHDVGLMPHMTAEQQLRAKVAAQLPGVGFERAIAAARYFDSVLAMVNAHPAEWERVEGIGKVIAKAVAEAVR